MRFNPIACRRAKSSAWMCLVAVLIACEPTAVYSDSDVKVTFADTELSVPQKFLLPALPNSLVPQSGRLDDQKGISLRIPVVDLGLGPDSDTKGSKGIVVLMTALSGGELPRDAQDAWNAQGLYESRIVEYDYAVGLFRVYPRSGYPKLWQYFESSPNGDESVTADWVASCNAPPGRKEEIDLSNISCHAITVYKDVESQITVSGDLVSLLDAILQRYENLLKGWEVR